MQIILDDTLRKTTSNLYFVQLFYGPVNLSVNSPNKNFSFYLKFSSSVSVLETSFIINALIDDYISLLFPSSVKVKTYFLTMSGVESQRLKWKFSVSNEIGLGKTGNAYDPSYVLPIEFRKSSKSNALTQNIYYFSQLVLLLNNENPELKAAFDKLVLYLQLYGSEIPLNKIFEKRANISSNLTNVKLSLNKVNPEKDTGSFYGVALAEPKRVVIKREKRTKTVTISR